MGLIGDVFSAAGSIVEKGVNIVDDLVPDAGDIVEDVADAILPAELEWLGDVASGATNILTGNPIAATNDALDLLKDLNFSDPDPPPTNFFSAMLDRLGEVNRLVADRANQGSGANVAGEVSGSGGTNTLPDIETSDGAPPGADQPAPGAGRTDGAGAASPAATSQAPASPGGDGDSDRVKGKEQAKAFIDGFKNDPEGFMEALREGNLPPGIEKSPQAMMMIQQHMQDIQRMFSLMTQMLQAMHEMQMGIVRNIRA